MVGIEAKLGRIASKIKGGTEDERLAAAKELYLLAELLIDMYGDEDACSSSNDKTTTVVAGGIPFDAGQGGGPTTKEAES